MKKHLVLAVSAAAALMAVFAPSLAGAETPASNTSAITIEEVKGALKFVAPESVRVGEELEILNDTNPKKVGPHTFSLVTQGSLPKTKPARKSCFTPKHICMSIAHWHGFDPKTEKISINPAKAGPEGWSTLGSTSTKGDSWFTGKEGQTLSQQVTADPATTPTLFFLCAVHPWMQGKVKVLPAS